jgi:hypothetical protein
MSMPFKEVAEGIFGTIGGAMGAQSAKDAANIQGQQMAAGIETQLFMFNVQNEWQNKQWEAMQPFIEQEMEKFGFEKAGWKFGLQQQEEATKGWGFTEEQREQARIGFGFSEEQREHARKGMGFDVEKMQFGTEEMDLFRERMDLAVDQHDFFKGQMDHATYGLGEYRSLYEKGPEDFQNSERWKTGEAISQMSREKNADALAKFGAANGIGGEALALELEKQMAPIDQGIMMGQYDAHQADYQRELQNAQAMSAAYGGGGDTYSGGNMAATSGGGIAGPGSPVTPGGIAGPNPLSSGFPGGGPGVPNFSGYGAGISDLLASSGAAQAGGILGAGQAWQNAMGNAMGGFNSFNQQGGQAFAHMGSQGMFGEMGGMFPGAGGGAGGGGGGDFMSGFLQGVG